MVEPLIPYDKLTHINYSFLTPKGDGTFNPLLNTRLLKIIVQKAHTQGGKVLISVGGWGWDSQFEELAAQAASRTAFVQNLKAFVDENQLDGADIDWEYPDPGQSSQNFLALITELRTAMPDQLLTAAVVAYGDEHGLGIPIETFDLLDFINIMTYDGHDHGTMDQFNKGIEYWSSRGLSQEKMVIGVPFYSRPDGIPYTKLIKQDPAAAQVDSFEYTGKIQYYNGIPTIEKKTKIALQKTGGIMFWALDHDAQGDLSLLNAIYQTVHQP
jgi:GH18 family chitinase